MKTLNLNTYSFDELLTLHERVGAEIEKRSAAERRVLEERLNRLNKFSKRPASSSKDMKAIKALSEPRRGKSGRRKVAPKYRNPKNSDETWSGRGLQPRWLKAALTQGGSLEDYKIV